MHSPLRIIPAQKFLQIRMHFPAENHPRAEISSNQDAFLLQKASLFGKIRRQGLFSRGESIPIRKNSLSGIIFPRRMHPYSEKFVTRDYCFMENASLTSYFVESGCIPPSKCIPDRVFHQIRMHSSAGKQTSLQRTYPSSESQLFFPRITVFLPQNHFSAFTRSW